VTYPPRFTRRWPGVRVPHRPSHNYPLACTLDLLRVYRGGGTRGGSDRGPRQRRSKTRRSPSTLRTGPGSRSIPEERRWRRRRSRASTLSGTGGLTYAEHGVTVGDAVDFQCRRRDRVALDRDRTRPAGLRGLRPPVASSSGRRFDSGTRTGHRKTRRRPNHAGGGVRPIPPRSRLGVGSLVVILA
jgi:hypothetical protein